MLRQIGTLRRRRSSMAWMSARKARPLISHSTMSPGWMGLVCMASPFRCSKVEAHLPVAQAGLQSDLALTACDGGAPRSGADLFGWAAEQEADERQCAGV